MTAFSACEWLSVKAVSWKQEKWRCCTLELYVLIGTRLNTLISFVPEHKSATSSQLHLENTAVMTNSQGRVLGLLVSLAIFFLPFLTCTFVNVTNSSLLLCSNKSHLASLASILMCLTNFAMPYLYVNTVWKLQCRGTFSGCWPEPIYDQCSVCFWY